MKIHFGALSAWSYHDRRQRCWATWVSRGIARGHGAHFLLGKPDTLPAVAETPQMLLLAAPNDYASLPQRTRAWCEWSLTQEWDWLFKCDDDTYVAVDRLEALVASLPSDTHYVGEEWQRGTRYGSGGAGYLLSRRAAAIVAEKLTVLQGSEDLEVGRVLREAGIQFHTNGRFVPFANATHRPLPTNDLITGHAFSGDLFLDSHRQLYPS